MGCPTICGPQGVFLRQEPDEEEDEDEGNGKEGDDDEGEDGYSE